MVGIAQFIVLFAGPLGILGLTGFLVVRWIVQSRRREPQTPQLAVIPGHATLADGEQPVQGDAVERPALRLVTPGRPGERSDLRPGD